MRAALESTDVNNAYALGNYDGLKTCAERECVVGDNIKSAGEGYILKVYAVGESTVADFNNRIAHGDALDVRACESFVADRGYGFGQSNRVYLGFLIKSPVADSYDFVAVNLCGNNNVTAAANIVCDFCGSFAECVVHKVRSLCRNGKGTEAETGNEHCENNNE